MTEPRLKTGLWVQAHIRLCDASAIAIAVLRRGDADAGAVVLKINRLAAGCQVYSQARAADGARVWMPAFTDGPVAEAEADAHVARQSKRDPDLWVIEVEDPEARYQLDAPVL